MRMMRRRRHGECARGFHEPQRGPYTSGYFRLVDFAKAGILMSLVIAIIITAVIAVIGPLTGIYNFPILPSRTK